MLLAGEGHDVVGLDFSEAMVEAARNKAADAGLAVAFEVGDAAEPPLPDGAFDVVVVRHVLWAMPDPHEAIERWVRLLTTDGVLVLIEGLWSTGAGLDSTTTIDLVRRVHPDPVIRHLTDPDLWGRAIEDERYMVVSSA